MIAEASPRVNEVLASPRGQATLVGMACEQVQPTFSRTLARWVAAQDPAAHEADHQAQRRERFLHLSDRADGTHVRGRLDRMTGHAFRLALEAVGEAPGADRSPEQARADALGALAEKVLALPETGSGAAVRPHVSLIMSEESWVGLRGLRGLTAGAATDGAATEVALTRAPALEDGTPVPTSEALRILCDCDVTRIVVDAESQPVDLGRTQRLYTGVQRRAIIARDGGCIWPGCGKPARWCEIHHIRWWDRDGGVTSLENAALLCSFHHHEIHRYDLSIERVAGAVGRGARPGAPPGDRYVFRLPDGSVVGRSGAATLPAPGLPSGATAELSAAHGTPGEPTGAPQDRPPGRPAQPTGPPGRSTAATGPPPRAQAARGPTVTSQPSLDLGP
ncbi:HNH endonuclease signature motif containing protein [Cellulomonas fengjieae]|uniref:DUF222 domain-containing protein n=1 Tax=Cellulomonas fengjieae TaxID=2819978 RepID=A0ABS3SFG1_9CELL|nr:HNH endonuclease signature motif containing protein [Cellulomonas fengjieae]MBO3084489.1 DUF222 domain-containing protein [Cellulomonas fengjieae]QVI67175.1 DUF222 domain-containing protein [Cellulomonas fengjieae]